LTASFEQVLMYTGITLLITSTLTVISLFVLRMKEPDLVRPYKVWGYPFTPLIFLFVNIWILYYSIKETTLESIVGFGIILLSIALYFLIPMIQNGQINE
jgi:APA family basic amino acid/polyamine antiporter